MFVYNFHYLRTRQIWWSAAGEYTCFIIITIDGDSETMMKDQNKTSQGLLFFTICNTEIHIEKY